MTSVHLLWVGNYFISPISATALSIVETMATKSSESA